jgi:hypothetical protein
MNPKSLAVSALAVAAIAFALLAPPRSIGQAATDDAAVAALITELTAQQAVIVDNQAKIDAKLAIIGENVRQARIYSGRSR